MSASKMREGDDSSKFLVAIEMGLKSWLLSLAPLGREHQQRRVTVSGGGYAELSEAVRKAKEKFGVGQEVGVVCCYEAGRDGFYPYRQLTGLGYEVWVVDSSSIEVNRRARRAKSDGVDVGKLQNLMQRQSRGEKALKIVRVPGVEAEDARQRSRERKELTKERGQQRVRMQSLVFAQGYREFPSSGKEISKWLEEHREGLPEQLYARLQRECARLELTEQQLKTVNQVQHQAVRDAQTGVDQTAQQLTRLVSIGETSASVLSQELFGWRRFRNRREVGAVIGATPTPYQSGQTQREQGIDKQGNRRVRALMVEVAWRWLELQPESAISRWFEERFTHGKRHRRVGIVAVARKLVIALWHYLEHGVVPKGALLKAAT